MEIIKFNPIKYFTKLNKNSSFIDENWSFNFSLTEGDIVNSIAIDNNYVYVGAGFNSLENGSFERIVRINKSDATLDFSWNPIPDNSVFSILTDNEDIYIGGAFASINGQERKYLAVFTEKVLPVELVAFAGKVYEDGNVLLKWNTATEKNNYGFEVERKFSNDKWEKIEFVLGAGNSNIPGEYIFVDKNAPGGIIQYRLKQIDFNGNFVYSNIVEVSVVLANNFIAEQNYPNPFNPETLINYAIPEKGKVSIKLYNTLGQLVSVILDDYQSQGGHMVEFDASNLASGAYVYKVSFGDKVIAKKMCLIK